MGRGEVWSTGICGTATCVMLDDFSRVTMVHEVSGLVDEVGEDVAPAHLERGVATTAHDVAPVTPICALTGAESAAAWTAVRVVCRRP